MNLMRLVVQLKPFNDFIEEYKRRNTYYTENLSEQILYEEGNVKITFQHIINLSEIYKDMINE